MNNVIRWGILAPGGIARKFATGLQSVPDAKLVAVGSRTQAKADVFAAEFNVPNRHGSYEALVNDPEVDVIYIASPHPAHFDNAMLCLNAGKAVLCEKPFALNEGQLTTLVRTAREKQIFLMEAMWTRFTPVMTEIRDLIAAGALGDLRLVQADLGFRAEFDPQHRLFNPDLGGGALLDVGIYPISFASMLLGETADIVSTAEIGVTGVDEQSAYLLNYYEGQIAVLSSGVRTHSLVEAAIMGTEAMIRIPSRWYIPQRFTLIPSKGDAQVIEPPFIGNGYNYEAVEVGRCLREGLLESPIMPLDESLGIMRMLDRIRAQWGLVYPAER